MRRYVAASAGFRKSAPASGGGQVEIARAGPASRAAPRCSSIVARIRSCERVAVLRVPDRELENVLEPPGPEARGEGASQPPNAPGTQAASTSGPGNELVAELVEALDRRRRRCDALPAEHDAHLVALGASRRPPASRRRARSGAARRPAARSRSRRLRRTRCRPARAPTSRLPRRASASTRPSRRCRAARGAW